MTKPSQGQMASFVKDCRTRGGLDLESAVQNEIVPCLIDPEVLDRIRQAK